MNFLLTSTDPFNSNLHFQGTSFTCVTGGPGVSWLTVTDGCPTLWNATLPVPAVLPPAGWMLLSSITVLTLVAFAALAAVGVSLWNTLPVRTSVGMTRCEDNRAPVEMCVLSVDVLQERSEVGLPVAHTGVWSHHLGTQNPVATWRAIARDSGFSSLPTRSLGTNTAGVTPCKNAVALATEENGEKCNYWNPIRKEDQVRNPG